MYSGGQCITIICADDQPCEIIKINSSNDNDLRDFLENKSKATLVPREIK